jgi:hypothetical protein
MIIGVHLFIGLCSLPINFLPESIQPIAAILSLILFWPPALYLGFTIFYPDYYTATAPAALAPIAFTPKPIAFTPKVCFSCTAELPPGSSVCPSCGWSFEPREHV